MIQLVITLVLSCATLFTAFPPLYWWRTRGAWKRSTTGRYIMLYNATLAALLDATVAVNLIGEFPGIWSLQIILFTSLLCVGVWQLFILYSPSETTRKRKRANPPR